MEDFKVIIAGSRNFNDYKLLKEQCNKYLRNKRETCNIVIVSGHAYGADSLGEKYAKDEGFSTEIYPAQWDTYGKRAGYLRNEQMAKVADVLIAFWDGESRGTKHMIDIMNKENKQIRVVRYDTTN